VHIYSIFNEPIEAATPEAELAYRLLRRMATHLGADMAPTHFAALMRRAGTVNSKEAGGPCQVIVDTGARCEPFDVEAYLDLVEDNGSLFSPREEVAGTEKREGPVEVEAELAAMTFGDANGAGVNATHCRVIPSLIWRARHCQSGRWGHYADGGPVGAQVGPDDRGEAGKRADRRCLP
jgi:hypothetical protein